MPKRSNRSSRQPSRSSVKPKPISSIDRPRSWAIYGKSGSGKTTFSGSFPKPILYIDVKDEGTDSISDIEGIDVIEVTDREELEDVYWFLHKDPDKYKTVVIDTLTQLQQVVVEEIASRKTLKGKAPGDWGSMTKQDWGEVSSYLKTWITNYRDLPLETVFIAQDRVFNGEDEDSDSELAPEVGPRLSPSVSKHLCAAVSVIGHAFIRSRMISKKVNGRKKEINKIDYCLRIGPHPVYTTKIRKPLSVEVPDLISNPTYGEILGIINGEEE